MHEAWRDVCWCICKRRLRASINVSLYRQVAAILIEGETPERRVTADKRRPKVTRRRCGLFFLLFYAIFISRDMRHSISIWRVIKRLAFDRQAFMANARQTRHRFMLRWPWRCRHCDYKGRRQSHSARIATIELADTDVTETDKTINRHRQPR
jgi:hypothetical protein